MLYNMYIFHLEGIWGYTLQWLNASQPGHAKFAIVSISLERRKFGFPSLGYFFPVNFNNLHFSQTEGSETAELKSFQDKSLIRTEM